MHFNTITLLTSSYLEKHTLSEGKQQNINQIHVLSTPHKQMFMKKPKDKRLVHNNDDLFQNEEIKFKGRN